MSPDMQLLHGDCMQIMPTFEDKSFDLILTDIPYGCLNQLGDYSASFKKRHRLSRGAADEITFSLDAFAEQLVRLSRGSIYVFCGTEQVSFLFSYLREKGFSTRQLILSKTNPAPINGQRLWLPSIENCVYGKLPFATFNEFCKGSVFEVTVDSHVSRIHPTVKPLSVIKQMVLASTNPGDCVLDPCMGSGTTGLACKETGRKFTGIELNDEYFTVATDRINSGGAYAPSYKDSGGLFI